MPVFTIEKVTTRICRERRAGVMHETRTLEAEGRAAGAGTNRACVIFDGEPGGRAVGYLVRESTTAVTVVGRLPPASYAAVREALATGGRLQVVYETRDGQTGHLRRLGFVRAGQTLAVATGHRGAAPAPAAFATP
jgi:hypothetical protein